MQPCSPRYNGVHRRNPCILWLCGKILQTIYNTRCDLIFNWQFYNERHWPEQNSVQRFKTELGPFTMVLSFICCIVLFFSKELGGLLAEMVLRNDGLLVSVGYDLCPNGMSIQHTHTHRRH